MRVSVLFFGVLKDLFQEESCSVEVAAGETVGGLLRLFEAQASKQSEIWGALAVAVNREYAERSTVLHKDDEVALLPPVSGGLIEVEG